MSLKSCIFSVLLSRSTYAFLPTTGVVEIEAVHLLLPGFNSALTLDLSSQPMHSLGARATDHRDLHGWLAALVYSKAISWHGLFLGSNCRKSHLQLIDPVVHLTDVDVVNPDEKSIMTYVAQFLRYSKDASGTGAEAQVCPPKHVSSSFLLYATNGFILKIEV